MFNNKKLGIRLVAILMTLLMTVAIFAGCNSKQVEADIDAAQSEAEAANAAAAAANAAAQSAADAAAALAAQLAAAQAAADSAKAAADSALKAAQNAQSGVDSIVKTTEPVDTDSLSQKQQEEVTKYINTTVLGELSQLKVKYLTVHYLWYTEANYSRIAKMFDDAYMDIYRATTIDGVKGVIAKLTTDVAAVANIVSDGEAIQAQIKAFGDVDKDLFTTQEPAVVKARADFNTWLNVYKSYFLANGKDISNKAAIEDFAYKAFGVATTTLNYAESKIVTLKGYAETVSQEAYDAVIAIWGKTAYDDIKANSAAIEDAYNLYRIFMTANGGDGSLIKKTVDKKTLTGEQFVKQYVLVLYDNWFAQYLDDAKTVVDSLPFAFPANPIVINDLQRIAVLANASFINWTYSGSFKGTLSLEDAYLQVDNCISKAIVDMTVAYYSKADIPEIQDSLTALESDVSSYLKSTDSIYKTFDIAFGNEYVAAIAAYKAEIAKTSMLTYDALVAKTNIEDLRVLTVSTATKDVVTTVDNAVWTLVQNKRVETIEDAAEYFLNAKAELKELKAFYDFKRALCVRISKLTDTMDAYDDSNVLKLSDVRIALGGVAFTEAEAKALDTAVSAVATSYRNAVMALKYNDFSAVTYQAKDADGKLLYYSKAAGSTTTNDASVTVVGKYPLNVQVDKLVVAKDKVVSMYGEYSDKMLKIFADLVRTDVNTYVDKCLTEYNTNYPASTTDTLNLNTDIANYVTYLKAIASLSSIGTFDPASFSLENDAIATGLTSAQIGALGYTVESLKNNEYLYRVTDFAKTEADVASNYATRFDEKVNQYVNLVKSGAGNINTGLQNVRLLAYEKDKAILNLNSILASIKGTWDATKGEWAKTPAPTYEYYSSRKDLYLSELDKVYNRLTEAIKKVTMLDEGVTTLDDAKAIISAISALNNAPQDGKKASESKDDFSFAVAFARYYEIDPAKTYNWAAYNAQ